MIKVFNPNISIDVNFDWFEDHKYFQPTIDIDEVLKQPIRIACLPVFFNSEKTHNFQKLAIN